jgi:hypothetical protein
LPEAETSRARYLQLLRENYVCIAAEEPQQSIGWNVAEYSGAGRAIVSSPLRHELQGSFKRGRNYVEYDCAEQCVQRLGELLGHSPAIHRMEAANFAYYNAHVRPDAMVLCTLKDGEVAGLA